MKKLLLTATGASATLMAALAPAAAHAACANTQLTLRGAQDKAATALQQQRAVTCLVNQERARYGLPRYTFDARLQVAAQKHTDDMVKQTYFEHDGKDGRTFGERIAAEAYKLGAAGENIGLNTTPRTMVDAWLKSPGHCRSTLSPDFTQLGVGVTEGAASTDPGLKGNDSWTQVFARPIESDPPSTDGNPADGCPRALGPDQAGPGDDGTGSLARASAAAIRSRRAHPAVVAEIAARDFVEAGRLVVVEGSIAPDQPGERLTVVERRGKRTITRQVVTDAAGVFRIVLGEPRGTGHPTITVSLPARAGHNTAASTTLVVGVHVKSLPVK